MTGTRLGKLSVQTTTSPLNYHVNMLNNQSSSSQSLPSDHLLEYSIYSGNDEQFFQIDKTSGEFYLIKRNSTAGGGQQTNAFLDYERIQNLLVNVQCRFLRSNNEYTYAYSQINISIVGKFIIYYKLLNLR